MNKFTRITSIAAPLPRNDIDTDLILPARFLLLLDRETMGDHLFHDLRNGANEPFVLDTPPYEAAEVLVAGNGFGTGSSREHAVWALAGAGIRCVIAPGFGEIFQANCFKNGILPIVLDTSNHGSVMRAAQRAEPVTVDLNQRQITLTGGSRMAFEVGDRNRRMLLNGMDEIDQMMAEDAAATDAFERSQRERAPWLYLSGAQLETFTTKEPVR